MNGIKTHYNGYNNKISLNEKIKILEDYFENKYNDLSPIEEEDGTNNHIIKTKKSLSESDNEEIPESSSSSIPFQRRHSFNPTHFTKKIISQTNSSNFNSQKLQSTIHRSYTLSSLIDKNNNSIDFNKQKSIFMCNNNLLTSNPNLITLNNKLAKSNVNLSSSSSLSLSKINLKSKSRNINASLLNGINTSSNVLIYKIHDQHKNNPLINKIKTRLKTSYSMSDLLNYPNNNNNNSLKKLTSSSYVNKVLNPSKVSSKPMSNNKLSSYIKRFQTNDNACKLSSSSSLFKYSNKNYLVNQ